MAYLTIITVPVLLFHLTLQRAFIESIASSGIKGGARRLLSSR